jgi:hypothetical protein
LMENASRQQAQEECAHDNGGVGTRANLSMEVKGGQGGRTQDAHRQDVVARADPGARDLEIGLKSVSRAPPSSSQSNRSKSVAIGRRYSKQEPPVDHMISYPTPPFLSADEQTS